MKHLNLLKVYYLILTSLVPKNKMCQNDSFLQFACHTLEVEKQIYDKNEGIILPNRKIFET
jgi:hypothetical protein